VYCGGLSLVWALRSILGAGLSQALVAQKLCKAKKNRTSSSLTTLERFIQWPPCVFSGKNEDFFWKLFESRESPVPRLQTKPVEREVPYAFR
jgi:hypothetical protein